MCPESEVRKLVIPEIMRRERNIILLLVRELIRGNVSLRREPFS